MNTSDFEFLKELQHELKTQETDGQAAPRFWGIGEYEKVRSCDDGDEPKFIDMDSDFEEVSLSDMITYVNDYLNDKSIDINEEKIETWNEYTDKEDAIDVFDFIVNELEWNYDLVWVRLVHRVSQETGCFLTKRAAKKYLENNSHHHLDGHTYAMTAWRNPEFERFMNIFTNLDMDKLKTLIED